VANHSRSFVVAPQRELQGEVSYAQGRWPPLSAPGFPQEADAAKRGPGPPTSDPPRLQLHSPIVLIHQFFVRRPGLLEAPRSIARDGRQAENQTNYKSPACYSPNLSGQCLCLIKFPAASRCKARDKGTEASAPRERSKAVPPFGHDDPP
jgi:hypothetical protein